MRKLLAVPFALMTYAASAHSPTAEECPFYLSAARAILNAYNAGVSATDLVPHVMKALTTCSSLGTCPVKDTEDVKRVMDFLKETYAFDMPKDSEYDVDATGAKIEDECEKAAQAKGQEDKKMTPDPSVPSSGKQIEG